MFHPALVLWTVCGLVLVIKVQSKTGAAVHTLFNPNCSRVWIFVKA